MLYLYDSATIERESTVENADGIEVRTWTPVVQPDGKTTVKCRLTDMSNMWLNNEEGNVDTESEMRKFYCAVWTDIQEGDRVLFDGEYYKFKNIYRPRGYNTVHHLKIYLQQIAKWQLGSS